MAVARVMKLEVIDAIKNGFFLDLRGISHPLSICESMIEATPAGMRETLRLNFALTGQRLITVHTLRRSVFESSIEDRNFANLVGKYWYVQQLHTDGELQSYHFMELDPTLD